MKKPDYTTKLCKRFLATLVGLFLLASSLTSCGGGAGAGLGTTASSCFTGLPTAFSTAGHEAHFLGVRILNPTQTKRISTRLDTKGSKKVCLFAFQLPDKAGKYIKTRSHGKVFGNFVLVFYALDKSVLLKKAEISSLPLDFAHAFSIIS